MEQNLWRTSNTPAEVAKYLGKEWLLDILNKKKESKPNKLGKYLSLYTKKIIRISVCRTKKDFYLTKKKIKLRETSSRRRPHI